MNDSTVITLQIINLILTALSPIILSIAYCLKRVYRSKCCYKLIELDIRKNNNESPRSEDEKS